MDDEIREAEFFASVECTNEIIINDKVLAELNLQADNFLQRISGTQIEEDGRRFVFDIAPIKDTPADLLSALKNLCKGQQKPKDNYVNIKLVLKFKGGIEFAVFEEWSDNLEIMEDSTRIELQKKKDTFVKSHSGYDILFVSHDQKYRVSGEEKMRYSRTAFFEPKKKAQASSG